MNDPAATIINLLWQGAGGGVQNALSFIENLARLDDPARYVVFARAGSPLAGTSHDLGFPCREVAGDGAGIHRFSVTCKRLFRPGQTCFTFFGPPWLGTVNHLVNVCGVAYSNLYYPEIDFWCQYRGCARWKRTVVDRLRFWSLSQADYWIFETEVLAERAVRLAHYPCDRVGVVRMTASSLVAPQRVKPEVASRFDARIPKGFRFLFLAGAARNKRIDRTIALAEQLRRRTDQRFVFVTTMPPDTAYCREIAAGFDRLGLGHCWCNLGPCSYEEVASLISVCDSMCLFSVLESFSNNFVESWQMRKPLVCADDDWSRSIAADAAVYVDPEDPEQAAGRVLALMQDPCFCEKIVQAGAEHLTRFPTAEQKCRMYLEQIDRAGQLGKIAATDRRAVNKWRCERNEASDEKSR